MAEDEKFVYESYQDPETIREHIQAILEGVEKGRISLSTDGEEIVLSPSNLLRFSVKAKKKGGQSKLTVEISWKDARGGKGARSDSLSISSS